ncbi:MAG: Deoxyuridine 5'-triphosphate nucleotidohydrolase [Chlamydiia bacterium]|nr:Deoxyuridine 5'-triphosphate nucleotidohydrolase [Chlamydiia bacterium]MCH9618747.1 Deoxyuridine 5'-triphosphate nucleotidohydrolase [Chlamydiia bacterium]MCH9624513.1 Deoxyuridine 5'-triphosphate nucleotidohydrolase [Chlamydiia bacterium]
MNEKEVEVVVKGEQDRIPFYATKGAAGADIRAKLLESVVIAPGEVKVIPTGLFFEIPAGFEIQVRPRSGLAAKHGVTVLNTPGTIDSDYRGEVCVILINHSKVDFIVEDGMRVAQIVIAKALQADFILAEELSTTARGSGGFGHTGV